MIRALSGAAVVGGVAFLTVSPAHAQNGFRLSSLIGNSAIDGNFYRFNVGTGLITPTLLFDPRNPTSGTSTSATLNGVAYDSANKRVFFRETGGAQRLFVYDIATGRQSVITGAGSLLGTSSNAAFFGGSYWYVTEAGNTLVRADLNFANPNAPTFTTTTFANFSGTGRNNYQFGDIAISSTGLLYGNTANANNAVDFKIQLVSTGAGFAPSSASYTQFASTPEKGLQTAFSFDSSVVYGTGRPSGAGANAAVYRINPNTNASANIGQIGSGQWFRDIAGADLVIIMPEPATAPLVLLGGFVLVPLIRRRSLRKRGSEERRE